MYTILFMYLLIFMLQNKFDKECCIKIIFVVHIPCALHILFRLELRHVLEKYI